jgi:hypothetical protein
MPTSPDYCVKALYTHMLTLGWNKKSVEHLFQEAKDEEGKATLFKEGIRDLFIEERSLWFENFKEGVTLNGKFGCTHLVDSQWEEPGLIGVHIVFRPCSYFSLLLSHTASGSESYDVWDPEVHGTGCHC